MAPGAPDESTSHSDHNHTRRLGVMAGRPIMIQAPALPVLGDLLVALGITAFWTTADRSLSILWRISASPAASTGSRLIASRSAFFSQREAAGSSVTLRAF